MRRSWSAHWVGMLAAGAILTGLAWGETLEMVTYYPAPAAAGGGFWDAGPAGSIHNNNTGFVGIGTGAAAAPAGLLHVSGSNNPQQNFVVGNFGADFRVGLGTVDPQAKLHVVRPLGGVDPTLYLDSYSGDQGNRMGMRRARGTAVAPDNVQSDDVLGRISFHGLVGTTFRESGAIQFQSTGAWTAGSAPAYASFLTTPANSIIPQERMRITADGNVGIGTAAPNADLNVAREGSRTISSVDTYGTLGGSELWLRRARGTMAAPTAVRSNDSLGLLRFIGRAGGDFFPGSQIEAQASANWATGPTTTPAHLIFSTSPGAGTQERMRITDTGNVGIGDASPVALLTVGNGDLFQVDNTGSARLPFGTAAAPSLSYTGDPDTGLFRAAADTLAFSTNGAERMRINQNGLVGIGRVPTTNALEVNGNASKSAAGSWLANSDARVKTDIQDLQNALGVISRLHPVKFHYAEAYKKQNPSVGDRFYTHFIAQEYRQVFPGSVIEGNEGYLYLDSSDAVPYLVRAAQELQAQNEALRREVRALHQKVEVLEKQERR